MGKQLEEGKTLELDFSKLEKVANCGEAVLPAVAQDADSGEVLIVGYANRVALDEALARKVAVFWSTSRNELWIKGATSGEVLDLVDTYVNCEQNSILFKVRVRNVGACHTKKQDGSPRMGCYYRKINSSGDLDFVTGQE